MTPCCGKSDYSGSVMQQLCLVLPLTTRHDRPGFNSNPPNNYKQFYLAATYTFQISHLKLSAAKAMNKASFIWYVLDFLPWLIFWQKKKVNWRGMTSLLTPQRSHTSFTFFIHSTMDPEPSNSGISLRPNMQQIFISSSLVRHWNTRSPSPLFFCSYLDTSQTSFCPPTNS